MKYFLRPALSLGLITVSLISGTAQAGMSTPGQFSVSESGAATYTIPIQVPPGTAGIEPKLALSYSSQSGNGLLGMGWSLSGLSAITRCPQTMAQDGVRGSVNYDGNDRYCLDGQRLIAISGAYGASSTEYRTEQDSFAKIVSVGGSVVNGPSLFNVWTKSGQWLQFGGTNSSAILAQGKTVTAVWAINSIQDTKGNYLTINYTVDAANGNYYPQRIDYTGNANTGVAPNNSVQFQYQSRPDITSSYQAGSLIKNGMRLTNVQAYSGATLVRNYQLAYQISALTQRSQINSITECGASGCLPPITCNWSIGSDGVYGAIISSTPALSGYQSPYWKLTAGDVNGDGKTDIIALYNASNNGVGDGIHIATMLSNGDGTYGAPIGSVPATAGYPAPYWTLTTGDVNGDGKTDIIALYNNSNGGNGDGIQIVTMLSNGDGTYGPPISSRPATTGYAAPYWTLTTGDVNGDGKTDIIALYNNNNGGSGDGIHIATMLSNGDGTFGPAVGSVPATAGYPAPYWTLTTGDANGDGKTDIIALYNYNNGGNGDGIHIATMLSNGDGTYKAAVGSVPATTGYPAPYWTLTTGDANGDGKTDIIALYNYTSSSGDGIHIATMLSNGDGTYGSVIGSVPAVVGYPAPYWTLRTGDVNGDGKTDIIALYNYNSGSGDGIHITTMLSNGDGTYGSAVGSVPAMTGYLAPYWTLTTGDVNGDGKTDILALYNYSGANGDGIRIASMNSNGATSDVITSLIDGLGAATTITYKPLTNTTIYTKDSGANASSYPVVDLQFPLYAVSSVASSNGVGGTLTTNYSYGGLKADTTGRGLLGFRWMQTVQAETGITVRTDYRQDWPYTGSAATVKKTLAGGGNGGLLSQVVNSYQCVNPASGAACTIAPGQRYFPYVSQSVESNWDLNGAALPTATTTEQYDNYGNPTQIVVSTSDGYSKTTANTYTNDTTNWYLGRLTRASVTSTSP